MRKKKKNLTKDMTSGSVLSLIVRFAIPLLLGNIFQQTYNLVDAAIVGRTLGANALAAVGASTSVQFLVLGFCIGTCTGFAIPIAQQFGAKNYPVMRRYVWHGILLTVAIGFIMTTMTAIFCPQILHLMQTPEDIYRDAWAYLILIFLGIPCTLLYNFCSSILRAVGDSRTPFYFLALSACMNIGLDFLCIMGFGWGCAGAAAATVFSQGVSGLLCLVLIRKKFEILRVRREDRGYDGRILKNCLIMAVPMGLQYSITAIGSMAMQGSNNSLGSVYVSAYTAGIKIKQFALCPFDAFGTAAATFCGQNLGAGKISRVKEGIRKTYAIAVLYGLIAGIILILAGRQIALLFISSSYGEILDAAGLYLKRIGYFFWILGFLNVARLATQGLGYSGRAIISGVLEMVGRSIASLVFVPLYGFNAITFSDQTAWVLAAVYMFSMLTYLVRKLERKQSMSRTDIV